jgi:glycosyltransferase involved in cell wall biosynthesis
MDPVAGGTSGAIRNLTPSVCHKSHEVEIICHDDPASDYLRQEILPVHAIGRGRGKWSYHPALLPWLRENLPRFNAAVLNGLWQYTGYALCKAARGRGVPPYFVFPHGMLDPWFQRSRERRLKAIRNWCYWKLVEQHVVRNARAVFFTCEEEMRLARQTFWPYQPQNQICIGYGVAQPPRYSVEMRSAFEKVCPELKARPYHLFLGRIDSKKGLDLLIKAYASVNKNLIDQSLAATRPALVIAGPGADTLFGRQMRELAEAMSCSGSVIWTGMITGDAKWGALYGAETFILPSHQENFGIAVVEAMACRVPVLISDQVNIASEISVDKAGIVAPDTLEGTTKLFHVWEHLSAEERRALKDAAFDSYTRRFGIAKVAERLTTTIQALISSQN